MKAKNALGVSAFFLPLLFILPEIAFPVDIKFKTSPTGLPFYVDGAPYTADSTLVLVTDTTYAVAVKELVTVGDTIRYRFVEWLDTGLSDTLRNYTAPATNDSLTAIYETEYFLSVTTDPADGSWGTIKSPNAPPGRWMTANSTTELRIEYVSPYDFARWDGDLAGEGSKSPDVFMDGPKEVIAVFGKHMTITIEPEYDLSFRVDGQTYTGETTFDWISNQNYTLSADSFHLVTPNDFRYRFEQWVSADYPGDPELDSLEFVYNVPFHDWPDSEATVELRYHRQYYLDLDAWQGTVSGEGWYDNGSVATFVTDEDTLYVESDSTGKRYSFVTWHGEYGNGKYTGTDNPATVTFAGTRIHETARFKTEYEVQVTSAYDTTYGGGWVDRDSSRTFGVLNGTEAVGPGTQWAFERWVGTGTGSYTGGNLEHTLSAVNDSITETAEWEYQHELTIVTDHSSATKSGFLEANIPQTVSIRDSIVNTATRTRMVFDRWEVDTTGGGTLVVPRMEFTINSFDTSYTATAFWHREQLLDFTTGPGTVGFNDPNGDGWYDDGAAAVATLDSTLVRDGAGTRHVFDSLLVTIAGAVADSMTTDSTLTVTMDTSVVCVSHWHTEYALTITDSADVDGDVVRNPLAMDGIWHYADSTIELTANAASGKHFVRWEGDLTGTDSTETILMNEAKAVTAFFGDSVDITVQTNPDGRDFSVDAAPYTSMQTFTWKANELHALSTDSIQALGSEVRYIFTTWGVSTDTTFDYLVPGADDTVTAVFQEQFLLTVDDGGHSSATGEGWKNAGAGTTVCIADSILMDGADTRTVFDAWRIDFDGGVTIVDSMMCSTFTMDTSATATALWHTEYFLDVTATPGTATLSDTSGWYADGEVAQVVLDSSAVSQGAETRVTFDDWVIQKTGFTPYTNSNETFNVTMDSSVTATARWHTEHVLGVKGSPTSAGTVTLSPSPQDTLTDLGGYERYWYTDSVSVKLTANPDTDYYFVSWQDSLSGSTNPQDILVNSPERVTAVFGPNAVITVGTSPIGLDFVVDGGVYNDTTDFIWEPSTVHILNTDTVQAATADERYRFHHWERFSDGWTNTYTQITHVPTVDDTLFAYFYKQFMLTVDPDMGEATGEGWAWKDSTAEVCIVEPFIYTGDTMRYAFYGWEIDSAGVVIDTLLDACTDVPIDTVTTARALWVKEYLLDVTAKPGTATGGGWYAAGDSAVVAIDTTILDDGSGTRFLFDDWTGAYPGSYTGTATTFQVAMDGYIEETANWHTEHRLLATVDPIHAGEIILDPVPQDTTPAGTGFWFLPTDTVELDAFAYGFYTFDMWTGDLTGSANPDTLVMDGPREVVASFGDRVNVTVGTDPDSLIFYTNGTQHGATTTFRWIANEVYPVSTDSLQDVVPGMRYRFMDWNGIAVDSAISFSTPADTTLTAHFQKEFFLAVDPGFGEVDAEGWYASGTDTTFCLASDTVMSGMTRHIFEGWVVQMDGGVPDTVRNECFTVLMDTSATATSLWHTEYQLVVNADSSTATGAGWYTDGDSATVQLDSTIVGGGEQTRYVFDGWTVAKDGEDPFTEADSTFKVEMDTSVTTTATWHTDFILLVSVDPDSGGSIDLGLAPQEVIVADSAYWYASGDTIPATAQPAAEHVFAYWLGDLAGRANPDTLMMTAPKSIEAVFGPEVVVTVMTDPDSLEFMANDSVYVDSTTFTWLADTTYYLSTDSIQSTVTGVRYVFTSWNQTSTDTAFSFSTDVDTAFTAFFDEEMLLTVVPGYGVSNEAGGWYATDSTRSVCIVDTLVYTDEDSTHRYYFDGWRITRPDEAFTVVATCYQALLDTPITATALWHEEYFLATDVRPAADWGSISPAPPGRWYTLGDTALVCATPDTGHYFTGWSIAPPLTPHPTDSCFSVVMDTSRTVLAHFDPQYDVVIGTRPDSLSYWVDDTTNAFMQTSVRTWHEATIHTLGTDSPQLRGAGSRYTFTRWTDGITTAVRGYTATKDDSVFALFGTEFLLTVDASPGTAKGAGWYDKDESATLCLDSTVVAVTADTHRVFDDWLIERTGQTAVRIPDSCTTVTMDTTVTATALWFSLGTRVEPAGSGRVDVVFVEDDSVRVRAVPMAGFTFDHWEEALSGTIAYTGFGIAGDTSVVAVFDTLDVQPPAIVDVAPPPDAVGVPRNVNVGFRLEDDVYGVDLNSLDVYLSGSAVVMDGVDQTEGRVTIDTTDFVVVYSPATPFSPDFDIPIRVVCADLAHVPNVLDTTYLFTTGQGIITDTTGIYVAPDGTVWEDTTGFSFTFPPNSVADSTTFSLGQVNNPPSLPDSLVWNGPVYYLGPDGITFGAPVTVVFLLPASVFHESSTGSIDGLVVIFFNSITGTWTTVNLSGVIGGGAMAKEGIALTSLSVEAVDPSTIRVTFTLPGTGFFSIATAPNPEDPDIYNVPNPFNPDETLTNIVYRVPTDTRVTVSIFDVSGRLVREWDDGMLKQADINHVIRWDGKNGRGDVVANNVYFCIVETAENKKLIRKIAVLR